MYEVELKVRADIDDVRDELAARGATPLGTVEQEDTYYDAPHRDFGETDEALRIRVVHAEDGTTQRVTYKGPLVEDESKTREEFETDVGNPDTMDAILTRLGFEAVTTVRKVRDRYELEGFTVSLDAVDGAGEFVEIEAAATEDEITETREAAQDVLSALGLDPDEQIQTSYLEMLLPE